MVLNATTLNLCPVASDLLAQPGADERFKTELAERCAPRATICTSCSTSSRRS